MVIYKKDEDPKNPGKYLCKVSTPTNAVTDDMVLFYSGKCWLMNSSNFRFNGKVLAWAGPIPSRV